MYIIAVIALAPHALSTSEPLSMVLGTENCIVAVCCIYLLYAHMYVCMYIFRLVESLTKMRVLQVACGGHHTLALTNGEC